MKTAVLDSFLKFYVMTSTQVDLFGIYHVKVHFIAHQKMYVIPMLGRFVWTTSFVQCASCHCSMHPINFDVSQFTTEKWKIVTRSIVFNARSRFPRSIEASIFKIFQKVFHCMKDYWVNFYFFILDLVWFRKTITLNFIRPFLTRAAFSWVS